MIRSRSGYWRVWGGFVKDRVREWLERSPYGAALGVTVEDLSEPSVRLRLPYRDDNSNPGKALHGGVAASMIALGGQAVGQLALGPESGPWHTAALQVSYLAAAIGEPIRAEATLLRRGKEVCFSDVRVETEEGKAVARGLALVRGRSGKGDAQGSASSGDGGEADPGPMGPHIQRVPFIEKLGLIVEHMAGGRSRIVMPWRPSNADSSGGVHEGAVLALLDTTGAMASWAVTGPGRYKASTLGIQVQILVPLRGGDLIGYGVVRHRDNELFLADVEVAESLRGGTGGSPSAETGEDLPRDFGPVVARGTVIYRIVTD